MRPRRTPHTTVVFRLEGGTEDNDLWVQPAADIRGNSVLMSVWEPTPEERVEIAAGANIELTVWGTGTPPVAMRVTHVALGAHG